MSAGQALLTANVKRWIGQVAARVSSIRILWHNPRMRKGFLRLLLICYACLSGAAFAQAEPPAQPNLFQALGSLFKSGEPAADSATARNLRPVVSPSGDKRVALVIGNSAYPSSALENPRHDAAAMDAALQRLGFKVDTVVDGTKSQLDAAMKRLARRADNAEVAAVFYAGHGIQVNGANYIVPIDAKPQSERDLKREMVKLDDIIDDMGQAKVKLVFFDACRDNPLARSFSRGGARGMAAPAEVSGTLISFATKHGNTAADGEGKNSPYTQALIAELENPAGVEIEALLKNVNRKVKAQTRGQQEPWKYGSLDADFYFIFQGPTTVNVQAAPADPETETWGAAQRANTEGAYRGYLDAYPNGRFGAAARIALEGLKKPAPQTAPEPAKPAPSAVAPAPSFSPAPDDPEGALWAEVKQSGAREYYDAYLKQYPKGKYAALARVELGKIAEKEKAEKAREEADRKLAAERDRQAQIKADQDAWEAAKAMNTFASYSEYLMRYPQGRYAMLAQAGKQKTEREAAEREKQEAAQRERDAKDAALRTENEHWERVKNASDSAAVQSYLDRYPTGRYLSEARTKLLQLKKIEAETISCTSSYQCRGASSCVDGRCVPWKE